MFSTPVAMWRTGEGFLRRSWHSGSRHRGEDDDGTWTSDKRGPDGSQGSRQHAVPGSPGCSPAARLSQREPVERPPPTTRWPRSGASPSNCLAVGENSDAGLPIAEVWGGKSWAAVPVPLPQGSTYGELGGVSCTASTSCLAVGYSENKTGGLAALGERWDGARWSTLSVPTPSGTTSSQLSAVSCATAGTCLAVGRYGPNTNDIAPLAERWNGSVWSATPAPSLVNEMDVMLDGVSCASEKSCLAVGAYGPNELFPDGTLAEAWNGAAWRVVSKVTGSYFYDELLADSCTSASACVAVGTAGETGFGPSVTTAARWNGKRLMHLSTANPRERSSFAGVSCTSSSECVAVGTMSKHDGGDPWFSLIERWNGTKWWLLASPSRSYADYLNSVSCPSARSCFAVGSDGGKTAGSATLVEQWNGWRWSTDISPNP